MARKVHNMAPKAGKIEDCNSASEKEHANFTNKLERRSPRRKRVNKLFIRFLSESFCHVQGRSCWQAARPGTGLLHANAEAGVVEGPAASRSIRRGWLVVPPLLGAPGVTRDLAAEGGKAAALLHCPPQIPRFSWCWRVMAGLSRHAAVQAGGTVSKTDEEKNIFLLRISIKVNILIKCIIP